VTTCFGVAIDCGERMREVGTDDDIAFEREEGEEGEEDILFFEESLGSAL
jgi:hypothetical protein